ncbi:protein ALP1-like isoform X1 [Nasonia vitripennis]|uniref:DDE Tnp4 domain-containing protein n=2 Tax=Nasonia vitripennis TaxID=7425 RepID=A0A7M7QMY8_NASVI|nr:protein ALP1-like isoform X1 [Nasonia vitripennis]
MDRVIVRNAMNLWIKVYNIISIILQICLRKCNIRRWWVKPHLRNELRDEYGAYNCIFRYFKLNDEEEFQKFVSMTSEQFDEILELVRPQLTKRSKRRALTPEMRLAAVLNFLAHGNSIQKSAWMFLIGRSTMYRLVTEVCTAICNVLEEKYVSFPSQDDLSVIANMYWRIWHMPNCFGAIDGKHIRVKAPPNSGSYFFNYKKHFSIVLMGLSDAFCRFIWVNIGDFGSSNDAGIFQRSDLRQALDNEEIDIPAPTYLPRTDVLCPYFIIGDGAFPLKNYLMKPYTRANNLTHEEKIVNYRLSRARLTIERAFGILTKKWRILESPVDWKLKNIETVIMALICLHNFLITEEMSKDEAERKYVFHPYNIENEAEIGIYLGDEPEDATSIRNTLKDFFCSHLGSLP